jgi:hypothetical protein
LKIHANLCCTGIQNGLEREVGIETSCWAPKSPEVSIQVEEQDQEVQNTSVTPVSRRAVNFSFSAETADKLRDTTEKFASLKSGFLCGKAS